MPVESAMLTLFCFRGSRQQSALGTVVQEDFVRMLGKNSSSYSFFKLIEAVAGQSQNLRVVRYPKSQTAGPSFILGCAITSSMRHLHGAEKV